MEPVTHFLTGACIGRAGLNRKTAHATLAAVLAAEAADLDILWGLAGPVEGLKHHRGITHTFIAVPVVAAVVVGGVALIHLWRQRRRQRASGAKARVEEQAFAARLKPCPDASGNSSATRESDDTDLPQKTVSAAEGAFSAGTECQGTTSAVPRAIQNDVRASASAGQQRQKIHWGWLYLTAFIAALSHLLLDWTNNYGLRPFFPFNPRWYAGSFVFIAEPVMWALLLLALLAPALAGLIGGEIGARRQPFRGRGWAIFALVGIVALWCWRWAEHAEAMALVDNTQITTAPIKRMAMEPYPLNPFRWHGIVETANYYQTAEVDTRTGSIDSDPQTDVLFKPEDTAAVEAAKRTLLGRVYLDWGTWAVVRDLGREPIPGSIPGLDPPQLPPNRQWSTVEFTDLRFHYPLLGFGQAPARNALGGWVYIVDGREDAGEAMAGREQK